MGIFKTAAGTKDIGVVPRRTKHEEESKKLTGYLTHIADLSIYRLDHKKRDLTDFYTCGTVMSPKMVLPENVAQGQLTPYVGEGFTLRVSMSVTS